MWALGLALADSATDGWAIFSTLASFWFAAALTFAVAEGPTAVCAWGVSFIVVHVLIITASVSNYQKTRL